MILADTSVWIQHIQRGSGDLDRWLKEDHLVIHPFIIGELVCGNLPNRAKFILALHQLPQAQVADHPAVIDLVESNGLMGRGLGWVDAHLLASAQLSHASMLTLDKTLAEAASDLDIPLAT